MAQTNKAESWRDAPIVVYTDPVFFHKTQVHVGSRFLHLGRRAPRTNWIVQRVWTFSSEKYGRVRQYVANVRKLDDILEMRCEETGEIRTVRFIYMSYSAIWRLQD